MNDLVSVIVPVYNVEKYLEECLNSIVTQNYAHLEIILVDDGSTDSSSHICDKFAKKDNRIEVIHKKNGGLSDARNIGLKRAKGEYILFVDSDDVISNNMILELYNSIIQENADISVCSFDHFKNTLPNRNQKNDHIYVSESGPQSVASIYDNTLKNASFVAWNKLYKRKLFTKYKILYPYGKINEDTFVTYKVLYYAKKVVFINQNLYHYRDRKGSITNQPFSLKNFDAFEAKKECILFFIEHDNLNLVQKAVNDYISYAMYTYIKLLSSPYRGDNKKYREIVLCYYKSVFKKYSKFIHPVLKRIICHMFIIFPILVSKVYSLKTKLK